jgi:ABC-2 type transport system ATP-binding protein
MNDIEIRCDNLGYFVSGQPILKHITHTFHKGITYLVGDNGAGKSLLLKILTTVIPASEGSLSFHQRNSTAENGIRTNRLKTSQVRPLVAYLPQDFTGYPEMTVEKYLKYAALQKRLPDSYVKQHINEWLDNAGLTRCKKQTLGTLSAGQRRKVGWIQALMDYPRICLLDEPFEGIELTDTIFFNYQLQKLSRTSTIIIATHRLGFIDPQSDDMLLLLRNGEIEDAGGVWKLEKYFSTTRFDNIRA